MASVDWIIARRYLFSRQRKLLASLITLIAIAGVAVGVTALITVIGVIEGIDDLLFGRVMELYPHVRLASPAGQEIVIDPAALAQLRQLPQVKMAEPIIQKQAVVQVAGRPGEHGVQLIGVDRLGPGSVYEIIANSATGEAIQMEPRKLLLGGLLSSMLQVAPGTELQLTATNPIRTPLGPMLKSLPVSYWGPFNTKLNTFDEATGFISARDARELFRIPENHADHIHVVLKNPHQAPAVKRQLETTLGQTYAITTWQEENSEFFGALKLEKLGLTLILLLVILVAAFNIIGTLILLVIEKTREVGILRAIGASDRLIARVFLLDGMIIGLIGTLAGLVAGLGLCQIIPRIELDMPALIFQTSTIPVKVRLATVALIVISSMAICTLAALFPARQAARLNPVEALRFD